MRYFAVTLVFKKIHISTIILIILTGFYSSCTDTRIENIISSNEFDICIDHSVERRGDYYFVQYTDTIGITFLYKMDKKTKRIKIRDDFRKNIIKKYKYIYNLDNPLVEEKLIKKATQMINLLNKYNLYKINGKNKYYGIIEIYFKESEFLIYSKEGKKSINNYLEKFPMYKGGIFLNNNYYKVSDQ